MKKIIGLKEEIIVIGKKAVKTLAKFDTGAKSTSVDMGIAAKAMLGPVVKTIKIISASKKFGQRRVITKATLKIAGRKIKTEVNLANRAHSKQKVLVGRDIIRKYFIIDISKNIRRKSKNSLNRFLLQKDEKIQ